MLSPEDAAMVKTFADKVRAAYPGAEIIVFGSRARGDHQPDSDLDVCVVLETFDWEDRKRISELAWETCFCAHTILIETIMTRAEFDQRIFGNHFLIRNIRSEGVWC